MLLKAERNLNNLLDSDEDKIRLEASKFVAERIGKKYYSQRSESFSRNENVLVVLPPEIIAKNALVNNSVNNFERLNEPSVERGSEEDSS
jgi:hypothetical protein